MIARCITFDMMAIYGFDILSPWILCDILIFKRTLILQWETDNVLTLS